MSAEEPILGAIDAVYAAALDETLWGKALEKLAAVTGSQAASFWVLDRSAEPRLPIFNYINFDPEFIEEYLAQVASSDPTVEYLVSHPNQPIVHDGLVITEREKDKHAYYAWHGKHSDTRFRLVNQIRPAPLVQAGVALHRTRKAGRYEPQDIEQFAILHRHIERALAIGFRLGSLGTLQQGTAEVFDRNPSAVVLLDIRQHVVYANKSAERLRVESDGVGLTSDGIVLARKQDNDRLHSIITQALTHVATSNLSRDGAMQAARPSGKRPYSILVTPVSRSTVLLSTARPAVCLVITDPEKQSAPASERLRATFNLTDAEARLAALLTSGVTLRSAAEQLHVGYGTARVRLSEIFRKTETHRQAELVKLLLTAIN